MRGFISQMNCVVIDWLIDWPVNEEDQQSRHSSVAANHDNQSTLWVQVHKVIIKKLKIYLKKSNYQAGDNDFRWP